MHFDVGCDLFWSKKNVMRWDIDELEKAYDQSHIFVRVFSLSPQFALYFEQHQMIHELGIVMSNCTASLVFCK